MSKPADRSEYLEAKLRTVSEKRRRLSMAQGDISLYYGDDDPLQVPLSECEGCDNDQGEVFIAPDGRGRWVARCWCGREAEPARKTWQAALNWNYSAHSRLQRYTEVPFFGIADLEPDEARSRLARIQEHLCLRANEAGLRRRLGEPVGRGYQERLKAYKAWAQYALVLVNHALRRS